MDVLVRRVQDDARAAGLLPITGPVVLGVSGGLDSVALALVWQALLDSGVEAGEPIIVAHLNHGLRGDEADGDEEFVRELAVQLGWPFVSKRIERTEAHASEAALRDRRYEFLTRVAQTRAARHVVVAHHADDQAETVFLRICRGTGIDGLAGMRARRRLAGNIDLIRPLLTIPRADLYTYLHRCNQPYRSDSSNSDDGYTRNRVRNHWLPQLAADLNPNLSEALLRLSDIAAQQSEPVPGPARGGTETGVALGPRAWVHLDIATLKSLPAPHRTSALRSALGEIGVAGGRIDFHTLTRLDELLNSEQGSMTLPGGHQATMADGQLMFVRQESSKSDASVIMLDAPPDQPIEWGDYRFRFHRLNSQVDRAGAAWSEDFAWADLRWPLRIRRRREGDRVQPFGMNGRQKVQDVLVDAKVPANQRDQVPLVWDNEDLLWIVPHRRAERGRVQSDTQEVLRIECEPLAAMYE